MYISPRSARAGLAYSLLILSMGACSTKSQMTEMPPDVSEPTPVAAVQPVDLPQTPTESDNVEDEIVYFDFNEAVLEGRILPVLEEHARWLSQDVRRVVVVEGHADERGSREYNMSLGQSRADVIKAFLVANGVEKTQIRTVSFGEERPLDPEHNERAWGQNRRGVLRYEGVSVASRR